MRRPICLWGEQIVGTVSTPKNLTLSGSLLHLCAYSIQCVFVVNFLNIVHRLTPYNKRNLIESCNKQIMIIIIIYSYQKIKTYWFDGNLKPSTQFHINPMAIFFLSDFYFYFLSKWFQRYCILSLFPFFIGPSTLYKSLIYGRKKKIK